MANEFIRANENLIEAHLINRICAPYANFINVKFAILFANQILTSKCHAIMIIYTPIIIIPVA